MRFIGCSLSVLLYIYGIWNESDSDRGSGYSNLIKARECGMVVAIHGTKKSQQQWYKNKKMWYICKWDVHLLQAIIIASGVKKNSLKNKCYQGSGCDLLSE